MGTFNSLAELQAVTGATNNDYGFVIEQDAVGNEYYDRYKYNGSQWLLSTRSRAPRSHQRSGLRSSQGITSALVISSRHYPPHRSSPQC